MVAGWHGNFQGRSNTTNQLVKNSVNGTHCTMLISQERVRLKMRQSKLVLTVNRVQRYFPKKGQE